MSFRFNDLPVELAPQIFKHLTPSEKALVAALCKAFYNSIIPLLYGSIDLHDSKSAALCCITLAAPGATHPPLIRHWKVSISSLPPFTLLTGPQFMRNYEESVGRMTRLESYHCTNSFLGTPRVLEAVMNMPSLRLISFYMGTMYGTKISSAGILNQFGALRPSFPHLHSFAFYYVVKQPSDVVYTRLVHHILSAHSAQLRWISLLPVATDQISGQEHYPIDSPFPSLEWLSTIPSILDVSKPKLFPNLRTLVFPMSDPMHKGPSPHVDIALDSFPLLGHYSGPSHLVAELLKIPRPIRILYLDGATFPTLPDCYTSNSAYESSRGMSWEELLSLLPLLQNSSGPLRTLGLCMDVLNMDDLPFIVDSLPNSLEIFLLCARQCTNTEKPLNFGPRFLANLPQLHTFILSNDDRRTLYRPSTNMAIPRTDTEQLQLIHEWESGCPSLHTLVLPLGFNWKKSAGVWQPLST